MKHVKGENIMNVKYLVEKYNPLSPQERIVQFYKDFYEDDVLITSSFGTSSAVMLHLISNVNKKQKIHFIDTTYLFKETHNYKNELSERFGFDVVTLTPEQWKNDFTNKDKTWEKDQDLCCSVNKVEPLDAVRANYKVWVSGLLAYSTPFRQNLDVFEKVDDVLKFYPLIDVAPSFVRDYFEEHNLPRHPLQKLGYGSVGCTHCTLKGQNRSGRWNNSTKTECGLHIKKEVKELQKNGYSKG